VTARPRGRPPGDTCPPGEEEYLGVDTDRAIAARTGHTPETVAEWRRARGIGKAPRPKRIPNPFREPPHAKPEGESRHGGPAIRLSPLEAALIDRIARPGESRAAVVVRLAGERWAGRCEKADGDIIP